MRLIIPLNMDETEVLDKLHKAVDKGGFHRGYPNGPDDDRLMNFSERELRLIVWAYGCELRSMKEIFSTIQTAMWHEALFDHEENIIRSNGIRCFPIKETTVNTIHDLCAQKAAGITH